MGATAWRETLTLVRGVEVLSFMLINTIGTAFKSQQTRLYNKKLSNNLWPIRCYYQNIDEIIAHWIKLCVGWTGQARNMNKTPNHIFCMSLWVHEKWFLLIFLIFLYYLLLTVSVPAPSRRACWDSGRARAGWRRWTQRAAATRSWPRPPCCSARPPSGFVWKQGNVRVKDIG